MASGITNRGKFLALRVLARDDDTDFATQFFLALVKSTPNADTNIMSDLTEIAAGNGYTSGGQAVNRNATDFDVITEDDGANSALVQLKDFAWTASGGPIPSDSVGATYAVLLDANVTVGSRQVIAYFDLGGARVVSSGQALTLQNAEMDALNSGGN